MAISRDRATPSAQTPASKYGRGRRELPAGNNEGFAINHNAARGERVYRHKNAATISVTVYARLSYYNTCWNLLSDVSLMAV